MNTKSNMHVILWSFVSITRIFFCLFTKSCREIRERAGERARERERYSGCLNEQLIRNSFISIKLTEICFVRIFFFHFVYGFWGQTCRNLKLIFRKVIYMDFPSSKKPHFQYPLSNDKNLLGNPRKNTYTHTWQVDERERKSGKKTFLK